MARKISKEISKTLNIKLALKNFKVTNIVANAFFGFKINLAKLAEDQIVQKTDDFPGGIHHMKQGPVKAALIFSSGKVVFTGAKDRASIDKVFHTLISTLESYRIPTPK